MIEVEPVDGAVLARGGLLGAPSNVAGARP
jgi:hypothetical protein